MKLLIRKIIVSILGVLFLVFSGMSFYGHRNYKEPVVVGDGVTSVKKLSKYFPEIEGTVNDCNLYFMEGKEEGGTILVLGGTHPEEPAGRLATWIFTENATIEKGRIIVVLSANRSASTTTKLGGAYPPFYEIKAPWGEQKFRMGDRWSNPLDQWPDPEVYIHYPSNQNLAFVDIRNFNRTWPGRANGTLTEKTNYAFMQLIKKENVDVFIDLHEAELQYPVINTIVAHERGQELATFISMMLTDMEGFNIGTEYSPKNLHGLSHREVGDYSEAVSLLFEAPEPFLDATRGITNSEVLLSGKDDFVKKAGEHGLLFASMDNNGWHINTRVGRHTSSVLQTLESWTEEHPERAIICNNVPRYSDIIENGIGFYLKDPSKALKNKLYYE